MTLQTRAICLECTHLHERLGVGWTCDAYPLGIPDEIITLEHDHRRPFPGDNDIQFEPIGGSAISASPDQPIPDLGGVQDDDS